MNSITTFFINDFEKLYSPTGVTALVAILVSVSLGIFGAFAMTEAGN